MVRRLRDLSFGMSVLIGVISGFVVGTPVAISLGAGAGSAVGIGGLAGLEAALLLAFALQRQVGESGGMPAPIAAPAEVSQLAGDLGNEAVLPNLHGDAVSAACLEPDGVDVVWHESGDHRSAV